jgi:hypothetical protein
MEKHWNYGHNTPGYSPNPDNVWCAGTDWQEAVETFKSDWHTHAEDSDALHDEMAMTPEDLDEDPASDVALVESILHDGPPREGEDFSASYVENDGTWIAWWLIGVPADKCEQDHDD